jgi:hypothetical protein
VTPRETPRQAKVRRMAARYEARWPGTKDGDLGSIDVALRWLERFGLEVWQAARRQTIRELGARRPSPRARLVERARKAGL